MRRTWQATLDLLFPPVCVGCGHVGSHLCRRCVGKVRAINGPLDPIPRPIRPPHSVAKQRGDRSSPPIHFRACAHYRPPVSNALLELKYRPNRALADLLAAWLARSYRQAGWRASCVLPVPLGRERESERGFNQAGLLAAALGRQLALPVRPGALVRLRETRSQVGLGPEERRANVAGAFEASEERIVGRAPLVVDDLTTTGATLMACARALAAAGAVTVFGLTVAKAGE